MRFSHALLAVLVFSTLAVGQDVHYEFKSDKNLVYRVTIVTEMPESTKTVTGYLVYKPMAVEPNGQSRLACQWAVASQQYHTDIYVVYWQDDPGVRDALGAWPIYLELGAL